MASGRRRRSYASSVFSAAVVLAGMSNADNCASSTGFAIESQDAADALSGCSTITGDINIQGNNLTEITLNGIAKINGNLDASASELLQTITAPALSQISDNFTLTNLPLLTSLNFPLLDIINGGIYWDTLPQLTNTSFGNISAPEYGLPGTNVDGDISIVNTGLTSLVFLNYTHFSDPTLIQIEGNQQLDIVNLTGLSWGSNMLAIENNGPLAQVLLPDLKSVGNITIRNAQDINIPSLSQIGGTVEISSNEVDVLSAPSLTDIGGDLDIFDNNLLDSIDMPKLTSVKGNLTITNNTALQVIDGLDQLWFCQGSINLTGDFSSVSLPSLHNNVGGFHLNSSDANFDCSAFDKLFGGSGLSSSSYSCGAYLSGSGKDVAKHATISTADKLSKPVKAIIIILSVIVGLFICALLLRLYANRRRRRRGSLTGSGVGIRAADAVRIRVEEGDLDLEELETTATRQDKDALPKYRRVGKPGEVPPGYAESVVPNQTDQTDQTDQTSQTEQAGPSNTEAPTPPRNVRWRFW